MRLPRPPAILLLVLAIAACQADRSADTPAAAEPAARAQTQPATTPPASAERAEPLPASATTPLQIGTIAPMFTAQAWEAGEPREFQLAKALEQGPVVVYFFPAAFTPGCNIEARLFSQAVDRFATQHTRVVGITAGNADQLAEFSKDNETCAGKFPVAADPGARIAAEYGAVMDARPDYASRTSFLIDQDGRILAMHSDPKPQGHVEAMLAGASSH